MRTAEWTEALSVLDRVTAVLEAFTDDDDGIGISEIARRANLPKSTVARVTAGLVQHRYLDRVGTRFHLGLRIFELGETVPLPRRLRRFALPVMTDLRNATGATVRLGLLEGGSTVIIAGLSGRHPHASATVIGGRSPATSTAIGRALLAFATPASEGELGEVRRTGFAVHADSADHLSVACPIRIRDESPLAAISLTVAADAADAGNLGAVLRDATTKLSRRAELGGIR